MMRMVFTKPRVFAWLLFGIAAVFILFQFVLQFTAGVYGQNLMHDFHLTALGTSVLVSAYYYTYVAMQTPAGYLVDTFGARKMMTLGAVLTSFGCLCFALTPLLYVAIFGRVLMGLGMSCAFVAGLFLCRNWFPLRFFPILVAIIEAIALLGAMFGNSYVARLLTYLSWRYFIVGCAVVAFCFVFINGFLIRNTPREGETPKPIDHVKPSKHFLQDVKSLVGNYRAWFNGLYSGVMIAPQTVFIALWGIPFLVQAHHLNVQQATFASGLIFLGTAISAPLFGALYSYLLRPRYLLSLMALVTAVLLFVLIFDLRLDDKAISVFCFLIGVSTNVYLWNYSLIHDMAPQAAASTRIGFTNTLCVGLAPLLQLLIGGILSAVGHHHVGGVRVYAVGTYQLAMTILPVCCLLAAVLILFCRYHEAMLAVEA